MVRRVAVPREMSELLDRVDYGDAFAATVTPETASRTTARRAVELAVDGLPRWLLGAVVLVHRRALGLHLGTPDPTVPVPGWQQLSESADEVVYGVSGDLITPRLAVRRAEGHLVLSTVVRYDRPAARAVWAVIGPVHRLVSRFLLHRGARRAAAEITSR